MTLTLKVALALPAGPELDALVAERVMGWPRSEFDRNPWFSEPHGKWLVRDAYGEQEPWSPSMDIAAAWEVVEKQYDRRGFHSIIEGWTVHFWVSCEVSLVTEWAETAPLAICRAALRAAWKEPNPNS